MARIVIELDWARDPKGYQLAEIGQPKELRIVRKGTGQGPKSLPPFQPLASRDMLFKIFANTATSPAGALDFVTRFGPLTTEGWDTGTGDQVSLVTFHAEYMRAVLNVWARKQTHLHTPVGHDQRSQGRPLVVSPHASGPSSSLRAMVVWDAAAKSLKWEFHPTSLLDALWLQLGQALTAGAQIRQCEHCGDWFEFWPRSWSTARCQILL